MSYLHKRSRLLVVAVCCLALGAGASAIATAGASTRASAHHAWRMAKLRRLARHAIHGSVVLATRRGLVTVTFDRGRVDSVAGAQLTLTEGRNDTTASRTVTLTIPASARIRDDRRTASLSALKPGQRVTVIRTPRRTLVIAHAAKR